MKTIDKLLSELRQQDVKLWLDGDKLRYRATKDSLNPELLTQLKNQKSEIVNFLRSIESQNHAKIPPLLPIDRHQNLPLSFGQQRLWFIHQFEPNSSANNVPVTIRFTGKLNIAALEESIYTIAMRHEVLRTSFPLVDGKPIQSIAADFPKLIPIVDLQKLSPDERQNEARRISALESRKPFDLEHGPIARFMLIKFDDRDHLLIRNMHCIICDGASCDLFHLELISLYSAFSAGKSLPLDPLLIQYADFSVWQRQWLQGEILEQQVNYWRQKLAGNLSTIRLPFDRPRPPGAQAYLGNSRGMIFSKTLNTALTQLSQECGATLFMLLLTAFEIFLHRYSGQKDLLISFASAARGQVETEQLLGFFSNTLFLRTKLEPDLTFRELFDRVRQDCLEAYNHQDVPFEKLVEEIKPDQNQDRSPLFQTKFTLNLPWSEGRGITTVELPDLKIAPQTGYVYPGQTKYDLILVVREQSEGLRTVFDYNADLFDISTIDRMLVHFQNLLEGIVANPDCKITELPIFTAAEEQEIFAKYQHPAAGLTEPVAIEKVLASADNHLQIQLTKIWENTLGMQPIGLTDNFFDIGGNSLIAVKIFAQIEQKFNKNLPLSILFQAPTIAQLAQILNAEGCTTSWSSLVPIQPHGSKPPLFLIHSIGGNVLEYSTLAHYLGRDQPVYGLQSLGLDGKQQPLNCVIAMATHYLQEILTVQAQGPYFLVGYSFGGLVALEIARQLDIRSQQIALLGLLDTRFPHLQTNRPSLFKFISVHFNNLRKLQYQERVNYLKNWFQWYSSKGNLDELLINNWHQIVEDPHIINTIESNLQAYKNYVPQSYPNSAILFRSSVQPVRSADILDLGWSKSIGGDLIIEHLPGEHYGLLKEPNVQIVAKKIQNALVAERQLEQIEKRPLSPIF